MKPWSPLKPNGRSPDDVHEGVVFLQRFLKSAGEVIFNKDHEFKLAITCFLAGGHLLIEDIPGVGKTTFAKALAQLLGLHFGRIQFTNDLLPSDIIGTSIYDTVERKFKFHRGPIFSQLVLIDELNRATPKTQSALLQAMEERHVTVEGETYRLPDPFFIVATQNPRFQLGTFSLPESQLDRFMMRIQLGYPGASAEKRLLLDTSRAGRHEGLDPLLNLSELNRLRKTIEHTDVSDELADYVQRILEQSRNHQKDVIGLSPRAGLSLIAAAKTWAFLSGRQMVLPEDVQAVATAVVNHRISNLEASYRASATLAMDLVNSVEVA
jgi:MoxR-like ATPase